MRITFARFSLKKRFPQANRHCGSTSCEPPGGKCFIVKSRQNICTTRLGRSRTFIKKYLDCSDFIFLQLLTQVLFQITFSTFRIQFLAFKIISSFTKNLFRSSLSNLHHETKLLTFGLSMNVSIFFFGINLTPQNRESSSCNSISVGLST